MNIVFSYHAGDCDLAMKSAQAITAMGMNMRHGAAVLATKETPLVYEITKELEKSFPKVDQINAQDGFDGWPLGPNQMFVDASAWAFNEGKCWYFWEPDCVPMRKGWVDILEEEYRNDPKIMGHVYEGGMAPNGKTIYNMIVGSAIYPPDYLNYCPSARSLHNYNMAYRYSGAEPQPWDVRCRYNFLAIGRDTPLIRTYWNSVGYMRSGDGIVFGSIDDEADAVQHVTCPDHLVSPLAVVVHGCKDGSLHDMVIGVAPEKTFEEKLDQICADIDVSGYPEIISKDGGKPAEKKPAIPRKKKGRDFIDCKLNAKPRKRNLSDEERKRRSDRMKQLLAKKREQKALPVV